MILDRRTGINKRHGPIRKKPTFRIASRAGKINVMFGIGTWEWLFLSVFALSLFYGRHVVFPVRDVAGRQWLRRVEIPKDVVLFVVLGLLLVGICTSVLHMAS